jgi:eukaryotic-like serine/threonine-protein kinase
MSTPGTLLGGRYQLAGRIASGAVGEVWRATDLVLSRPVAVKRLRDGYAGQAEAMERFRAEARHAGALSHPGIAQVYDYGEADPSSPPFLVMEFVDGPSLAGLLDGGPLDPGDAMDVLAQVAAGLAAAHAAGLVHRDIKPANLLVAPDGHVKITDFGIAHAAGSAQLTRTGTMVGTPSYLAPERAAGASATPASDLYSLGVVGYECLAGHPPFQGTPMEVVAACQSAPVPPLPAAVPAAVAALVMELTAKDPAVRPVSASQVATRAARLRDALRDSPVATLAAVPVGAVARPAAATATIVAPPLPGEQAAGWPPDLGRRGVSQDGPGPRRGWPRWGVALAVAVAVLVGATGWLVLSSGATPAGPPQATASHPATAARTVAVNAAALIGLPVWVVRQRLVRLGLRPHMVGQVTFRQPAGTVLSVTPSGPVPVGGVVTVLVAHRPAGKHHGHDGGNGQGGHHGGGNGNGGD